MGNIEVKFLSRFSKKSSNVRFKRKFVQAEAEFLRVERRDEAKSLFFLTNFGKAPKSEPGILWVQLLANRYGRRRDTGRHYKVVMLLRRA